MDSNHVYDAIKVPWKVTLCHVGEKCWCRMVTSEEGEDGDVIPSGYVTKAVAEHIVLIHNAYFN